MPGAQSKFKFDWVELGKLIVAMFVGAASAGAAVYTANAEQGKRIAVIEEKIKKVEADVVPRSEHNAHWDAISDQLKEIKTDVREIRKAVIEKK